MKLSREWLTDFLNLEGVSNERLSEIVTTRIAEVDNVTEFFDVETKTTDFIIEIDNKSLTHRPDLWSHFGFARELSAVLDQPLKLDLDELTDDNSAGEKKLQELLKGEPKIKVTFLPGTKMRRMVACLIEGVSPVPSPPWMKRRLTAIGAGVRNFLVDLSNYVMHDCGQPNHFFDADRIDAKEIIIRFAKDQEPLNTLDGRSRNLTTEDLVIADSKTALDIGGVMGGMDTSVCETTNRIAFTAGTWDPILVRKSSQRNQARTDAAQRYEKNLSPYFPIVSLHRVMQLLPAVLPNAKIVGAISDAFPEKPAPVVVTLPANLVKTRLGKGGPDFKSSCEILKRLRMRFKEETATHCVVEVPHYRATRDISIAEDLIEEIGRVHGYENIIEEPPLIATTPSSTPALTELERSVKDLLRGTGFSELSNYSFIRPEYSEELGYSLQNAIKLKNPIDETQGALRTSLIPGMLQAVKENSRYGSSALLFEIGRGYFAKEEAKIASYNSFIRYQNAAAFEKRLLAISIFGDVTPSPTINVKGGLEFYAAVEIVKKLISLQTDSKPMIRPLSNDLPWMHPHRAADVVVDGLVVGVVAEARKEMLPDLKTRVSFVELELDTLLELGRARKFQAISKFPSSLFELSVIMPVKKEYQELKNTVIEGIPVELLREVELLSVYEGAPIPEGKKSVSIKVTFGSMERTLSNEELTVLQNSLMNHVKQHSYDIRQSGS